MGAIGNAAGGIIQGIGSIAGGISGGENPGEAAAASLDAIPDQLKAQAAGTKPLVADFLPTYYDDVDYNGVIRDNAKLNSSLMPYLEGMAERNTRSKTRQYNNTRDAVSPGARDLETKITDTIASAIDNGGLSPGTQKLLRRNFAEANKAAGRGGGLAVTAAGLGMRDYSTAATMQYIGAGQQQSNAARQTAMALATDPLKDVGQFVLGTPSQALETGFRNTENEIANDRYNNQGRTAHSQQQFNIDAAPDPLAQLELQIEMAKAGMIAGTSHGSQGIGSSISQVGAGIQQIGGSLGSFGGFSSGGGGGISPFRQGWGSSGGFGSRIANGIGNLFGN